MRRTRPSLPTLLAALLVPLAVAGTSAALQSGGAARAGDAEALTAALRDDLDRLRALGYLEAAKAPERGYIGVSLTSDGESMTVSEVYPKGPAAKAGLRVGDRVLAIGGRSTEDLAALQAHLQTLQAGERTTVRFVRDGAERKVELELVPLRAVRPEDAPPADAPGADAETLERLRALGYVDSQQPSRASDERGYLGVEISVEDGAMVLQGVFPGSPAEKAGLRAGDRVVRVGEHRVTDMETLSAHLQTLRAGQQVKVELVRGDRKRELSLRLAPRSALQIETEPAPEPAPDDAAAAKRRELERRLTEARERALAERGREGAGPEAQGDLRRRAEESWAREREKLDDWRRQAETEAQAPRERAERDAQRARERAEREAARARERAQQDRQRERRAIGDAAPRRQTDRPLRPVPSAQAEMEAIRAELSELRAELQRLRAEIRALTKALHEGH